MDDWKKMYSNNDTLTVAMPYFFEKFDPENYSVWYCEYNFPEELRLSFMSSNLIGGTSMFIILVIENLLYGKVCTG
jgi:elongation factor 1-gamma